MLNLQEYKVRLRINFEDEQTLTVFAPGPLQAGVLASKELKRLMPDAKNIQIKSVNLPKVRPLA